MTKSKWIFATAFVAAVVLSGPFSGLVHRAGLFYLVVGSIAAALMGFSRREIGAAFRHTAGRPGTREETRRAAYFWEAAARNAWVLGALGSALNFTLALSLESGGIADAGNRMIQSFVVTLYGLVLAVVCLVPAMKLANRAQAAPAAATSGAGPALAERVTGYAVFAAVLVSTYVMLVRGTLQSGPFSIVKVLLHWPAALVVFGGAIAMILFMGPGAGARGLTLGFGMTGLIALLMGLVQALFGFVHKNVGEIAAAVAFIVSASSFALLGLVAVAGPLEDREVMDGRREGAGPLSRMFWVLLPLLVFIFLVLTFIMVITPMTKPG